MSTRQLRKLQRQKELEQADSVAPQRPEEDDDELSDDPSPVPAKPRVSLFAALGGDDAEDEEPEDDEDDVQPPDSGVKAVEEPQPAASSKKSKKKKKKKKAGQAVNEKEVAPVQDNDDEIDKALKELNLGSEKPGGVTGEGDQTANRASELLNINPYHLKAMNEMRNMFGREAMEAADAEEEQDHNRRRRGPVQQQVDLETFLRERPGAPKLPEVTLRRNIFIQGREHWPRESAGGLTMKEIQKAPDGSWTEYAYSYEKHYEEVQTVFHAAVASGDPMRLVHLLKQNRK